MALRQCRLMVLLLLASTAYAETLTDFQTVCQELRKVVLVQADFSEEKTLHILTHPLHSSGTLMFSPEKGVYRVMEEPMHQELLVTRTHLVQKDSQGKIERMNVSRQPAAQGFVTVFLSFFSGDEGLWKKSFQVSFSGTVTAWQIEFVPLPKSHAAKVVKRMVLEGHEGLLDAMTLEESKGDKTRTTYSNQHAFYSAEEAQAAKPFPTDLSNP